MRINAHKVKDLERKSRQHHRQVEDEQAAQAVKGVHFADKYQHVQPKVTAYMKVCWSGTPCMYVLEYVYSIPSCMMPGACAVCIIIVWYVC